MLLTAAFEARGALRQVTLRFVAGCGERALIGLRVYPPHAGGTAEFYDNSMIRKNILLSAAVSATMAIAAPAFAESPQLDGQLPMYPRGTLDSRESSLTPAAIAQGVPLVLLTSDSVQSVVAWYATHVKTCSKQAMSTAVKFACPGGSIMIYAKDGKTQVALIPPMPGLSGVKPG
jgi:hypothetical protein